MNTAKIEIQYGYTGKDHLLKEIKRKAEAEMKPVYSSKSAAKKAAERAWFRVVRSYDLYTGCGGGFARAVPLRA